MSRFNFRAHFNFPTVVKSGPLYLLRYHFNRVLGLNLEECEAASIDDYNNKKLYAVKT